MSSVEQAPRVAVPPLRHHTNSSPYQRWQHCGCTGSSPALSQEASLASGALRAAPQEAVVEPAPSEAPSSFAGPHCIASTVGTTSVSWGTTWLREPTQGRERVRRRLVHGAGPLWTNVRCTMQPQRRAPPSMLGSIAPTCGAVRIGALAPPGASARGIGSRGIASARHSNWRPGGAVSRAGRSCGRGGVTM